MVQLEAPRHPLAPHLRGGPRELVCDRCGDRFEAGRFSLQDAPTEAERFVGEHLHTNDKLND